MSFIYRDFLTPSRFEWNRASALYHKFDRVWPKTTIDGIAVYSNIMVYWAGTLRSDTPFKRFLNALGVEYAQLQSASYDGVENVYFKLTPGKYNYTAPEKEAIVADLDSVFNVGDEFELYIHYSGETRRVVANHWKQRPGTIGDKIGDYTIDTVGIRNTLHSDPMKYFANAELTSTGVQLHRSSPVLGILDTGLRVTPRSTPVTRVEYDEDTTHIYATLALLDNGTTFQQQGTIYSEILTVNKTTTSDVYFDYSYKIKYKVIALPTVNSYVINQIDLLSNTMETALGYKGGNIYAISNAASDTTLKEAVIAMNNVEAVGLTYQGRLRVDAVAMMKRKEFSKMLGKIFGTGYTKKKTKWYEKVIAIVIVVVAVVVGVTTGQLYIAQGAFAAAAAGLAAAAAVLTVGMMVYATTFPNATDQTRMIGRWAQVVGLAAMVTGAIAAIQNSFAQMAQQAGKTTAQYTVKEYVVDMAKNLFDKLTSSITDKFTLITSPGQWSLPSLSELTMTDVSGWLNNIGDGIKMYMKFFGDQKDYTIPTEDEQATKEDGVESVFLAYEMVDNLDALYRVDNLTKNNMGGQKTENWLSRIT